MDLGRHLFGVYDDLETAKKDVKEYNDFRGGKYPVFLATKIKLNKEQHSLQSIRVKV